MIGDASPVRLGGRADAAAVSPGMRVVLDARPIQDPGRAPTTAVYLEQLLAAYDAEPVAGESFALFLQSDLGDPTARFTRLDVVGRRLLPPTRLLRTGSMTVDPFLLRGAALGVAWRADRSGAAGAVYHAAGGGALPVASDLPIVVTLLDLAPWELPGAFQRGVTARFGQRLRAQLLRGSAAVIVGSESIARSARRTLRISRQRLRIVPLAPRSAFAEIGRGVVVVDAAAERMRLGLPGRYVVCIGRYDARQDVATLLRALSSLASAGRPAELADDVPWPPCVVLVGTGPDDRAAIARAASRDGVGDALVYAQPLDDASLARVVAGARAVVLPVVSEAAGLPAIEAIAAGTPVVASAVGPLPELVGRAGILVEPRDPDRLAVALRAAWADDRVHARIVSLARERASADRRTWADVARETRAVYASVGMRPRTQA